MEKKWGFDFESKKVTQGFYSKVKFDFGGKKVRKRLNFKSNG